MFLRFFGKKSEKGLKIELARLLLNQSYQRFTGKETSSSASSPQEKLEEGNVTEAVLFAGGQDEKNNIVLDFNNGFILCQFWANAN